MNSVTRVRHNPRFGLIVLAFIAFIALGLPDGLLGVGWPSMRAGFGIELDAIGMLLIASTVGYMAASFMSGYLLSRVGVGRVLAASCFLTGVTLIGYTIVPEWWMMVLLGVFGGMGAGAIDAGLNTYVAANFGEGIMQWLHASWGIGITMGPMIMTLGLSTMDSWQFGYRVVGVFQIALAFAFAATVPMWKRQNPSSTGKQDKRLTDYKTPMSETLRRPQVWLSALLFLLYVGAETSLGTWTYTLLTESRGVDVTLAGFFAGSYWLTFTIGRILAGTFAGRLGVNKLVFGGLVGALLGSMLLTWNPSVISNVIAVAIIGVSIAPIFPALMSGTRLRVSDNYAANTIGLQMVAVGIGTATIPGLLGVLARQVSLELIPIGLLVVYAALFACCVLAVKYPLQKT